jgi:hypothetical protein
MGFEERVQTFGEYAKEKAWLIGISLAIVGIVLTVDPRHGFAWISAGVMLGFFVLHSIRQGIRGWELFSGPERYVQTGLPLVMLVMLAWVLGTGLIDDGARKTFELWGLVGIDFFVFFGVLLIVHFVPHWAKGRKECPDCLRMTAGAAKACSCGYHWGAEDRPSH